MPYWRFVSSLLPWMLLFIGAPQAAEIKNLVPVVWKLANSLLDHQDAYEKLILGALAGSGAMEEALDACKGDWVMKPSLAVAFSKGCQTLNMSLTQLGLVTHPKQVALWNFTVKNHCLEHIALGASEMSPRLCWNYGPEALLMHVRSLVQGNRCQPNVFALQRVAMEKWLRGLEMSLLPRKLWGNLGMSLWPKLLWAKDLLHSGVKDAILKVAMWKLALSLSLSMVQVFMLYKRHLFLSRILVPKVGQFVALAKQSTCSLCNACAQICAKTMLWMDWKLYIYITSKHRLSL